MPNISQAILWSRFCAGQVRTIYTKTAVLRRPHYRAGPWLASGNLHLGRGSLCSYLPSSCHFRASVCPPQSPHTPLGLLLEDSSQPVSGLAEGPLSSSSCAFPLGDTTFVSFLCNKSQRPEQTCWVLGVFLIIHWMGVYLRPWTPMRYLTQFINLSMRGRLHYLSFVRKRKNKRLSDLNKDIHTLIELGFQHLLLPVSWERETGATYWSIILIFLGITSSFQVKRIEYRRVQVYASKEQ